MTRPSGPAAPPGPSVGQRIMQECGIGWHHTAGAEAARRIDAALAEVNEEHKSLKRQHATICKGYDTFRNRAESCEGQLAEREAQLCVLREECIHYEAIIARECPSRAGPSQVLTATADAAARFVAQIRQESAEEMRERCAQRATTAGREVEMGGGLSRETPATREALADFVAQVADAIAAAIRALDAGDPAARRG